MPDSLIPEKLHTLRWPIVFTRGAWQRAVLLERSDHPEKLLVDRLSHVMRAAFEAHLAHPHEPYVLFEVAHIASTGHPRQNPLLQLNLSLLLEPDQPNALLIALAEEHQR